MTPPALTPEHALFLDIDGTLIDLAATPDAVHVPPGLPASLRAVRARLSGALAILSGRKLADIDHLLGPGLICAAEHGAVLRDQAGLITHTVRRPAAYDHWLAKLSRETREMAGVLIEPKQFSLSVHYRQAPEHAPELGQIVERLLGESGDAVLLLAHSAYELRPRGGDKGEALAAFMAMPPFLGRIPVFVGDDVTDEPAIRKAGELGGIGMHVARDFLGSTQAVRDWLV
jgi:trehalose 6-phosphate phosphatase